MGCKCESSGDKAEIISVDVNLENMKTVRAPLSTRVTPIKQIEDKDDLLTATKNSSFTDHFLMKNLNKIKQIDKIFLSQGLLNEINQARQNPKAYAAKVDKYKQFLYHNDKGSFLAADRNTSIALRTGLKAFDDCIAFLNNQSPLPPLKLAEELQLTQCYETSFDKMAEYHCLGKAVSEKRRELSSRFVIHNFHYDKNINMPEVSCVIQIIDDTDSNYRRRKNIFNTESKLVGINCEKISNSTICYYLLFGKEV